MATDAEKVAWLIRRLFRALAATADSYLLAFGLTAAERAVLEFLEASDDLTVPRIARRYQVSRQHVQVTINGLLARGLVSVHDNPRHKRSPLYSLTEKGRSTFAGVRARESQFLNDLFRDIEIVDVATTRRTLATLLQKLAENKPHTRTG